MLIKNNFVQGKMNLNVDNRLLRKGEYREAQNIRVANSSGGNVGAIEKSLSNKQLTNLYLGENIHTIGGVSDEFEEKLYWLVKSDIGSYIIEHDRINNTTSFVLKDTRGEDAVLSFTEDFLVTGISVIIDTDNGNRFLVFADNAQPKLINIERAKTYGENGFNEEMILLIKKPPLDAPEIELSGTESGTENNIEQKFLFFFYRYKYLDGEYSAFSPASEVAFFPKSFNFDYSTSTNESMINVFRKVYLSINTGSELVSDVELIFKEANHNNIYSVETYNKEDKGWGSNTTATVAFSNNKIYKSVSEKQLFRLFDNIPTNAKALEVINNLIVFGNYSEGYNIADADNKKIHPKLTLNHVSEDATEPVYKSNKSNRDYEVGIVYGEDYGRHTTVLTSDGNTTHIPIGNCHKKNTLTLTIESKPPAFASWYRLCVKQNKYDYDTIASAIFYEDGLYKWIKLDNFEQDKISEGDFIYVKSDVNGLLNRSVKTKVLAVESKDRNFLETTETTDLKQLAGVYFKVKEKGYSLDEDDIEIYESSFYRTSDLTNADNGKVIYDAVYYGETNNTNLTSSGTYTGSEDVRYIIEIDTIGDGTNDTFNWRKHGESSSGVDGVLITHGVSQELENGVFITFANNEYTFGDYWTVSAKANHPINDFGHAYGFYKSLDSDVIQAGANINIIYDEWNDVKQYVEANFASSKQYANLEEWFYEDNIEQEFYNLGINSSRIWFRRGDTQVVGGNGILASTSDGTGNTIMVINSLGVDNNAFIDIDDDPEIKSNLQIRSANVLFETDSKDTNSDIFYEIGKTYRIVDSYHTSTTVGDISQTASNNARLTLLVFNCFGWGNGFESMKIKDLVNADSYIFKTRPNTIVEDYKQQKRIASLTYGKPYDQTTGYNGLNEFNMADLNFKDLDDKYGEIQTIKEDNGDLDVWQEDKTLKVLYKKSLLYNSDGSSNVSKSDLLFDGVIPYAGEFGISKQPESLAKYGNYFYWTDSKRGVVLRKGQSGIEVISNFGLKNWFRDNLKVNNRIFGGIDPYTKQYVVTLNTDDVAPVNTVSCGNEINQFNISEPYIYYLNLNDLNGDITFNYNVISGTANIIANFNGVNHSALNASGIGSISFERDTLTENQVQVSITPVSDSISYAIANSCPVGITTRVVHVLISGDSDSGTNMVNRYARGSSDFYSENIVFNSDLLRFSTYEGIEGTTIYPKNGENIEIQAYKGASNSGSFEATVGDRLGYLISETVYSESDIETVLSSATFPAINTETIEDTIQIDKINFTLNKPTSNSILYLIWDYSKSNTAPIAVNDNANTTKGNSVEIDVLNNDSDADGNTLTPIIVSMPSYGTASVNGSGTITYTHDDSDNFEDSFTYKVTDGIEDSNTATVSISIGVPCSAGVSASGSAGIYEFVMSVGTETGTTGINYNAYSVPDRFQIEYDGVIVADSKYVGDGLTGSPLGYSGLLGTKTLDVFEYDGSSFVDTGEDRGIDVLQANIADGTAEPSAGTGTLTFNKTSTTPTTIKIIITAPLGSTNWQINGVCPS